MSITFPLTGTVLGSILIKFFKAATNAQNSVQGSLALGSFKISWISKGILLVFKARKLFLWASIPLFSCTLIKSLRISLNSFFSGVVFGGFPPCESFQAWSYLISSTTNGTCVLSFSGRLSISNSKACLRRAGKGICCQRKPLPKARIL